LRYVKLPEYIQEVLKTASFEVSEGEVTATTSVLPGCQAKGKTTEEAKDRLEKIIGNWIFLALEKGIEPPEVNGCCLVIGKSVEDTIFDQAQHEIIEALENANGPAEPWHPEGLYYVTYYGRCPTCRLSFYPTLSPSQDGPLKPEMPGECPECGTEIIIKPVLTQFSAYSNYINQCLKRSEARAREAKDFPLVWEINLRYLYWDLLCFAKDLSDYFGNEVAQEIIASEVPQDLSKALVLENKFLAHWKEFLALVKRSYEIDPFLLELFGFRAQRVLSEILKDYPYLSDIWRLFGLKIKLQKRKSEPSILEKLYLAYQKFLNSKLAADWAKREDSSNLLGHLTFRENIYIWLAALVKGPEEAAKIEASLKDISNRICLALKRIVRDVLEWSCLRREVFLFWKGKKSEYQRYKEAMNADMANDINAAKAGNKTALASLVSWEPYWKQAKWANELIVQWTYDREWYEALEGYKHRRPGYLIEKSKKEVLDWVIEEAIKVLTIVGVSISGVRTLFQVLEQKDPDKASQIQTDEKTFLKKTIKDRHIFP